MALYIEFPVGELGGYSKGIFKFRIEPRIEPYATIFRAGQGY